MENILTAIILLAITSMILALNSTKLFITLKSLYPKSCINNLMEKYNMEYDIEYSATTLWVNSNNYMNLYNKSTKIRNITEDKEFKYSLYLIANIVLFSATVTNSTIDPSYNSFILFTPLGLFIIGFLVSDMMEMYMNDKILLTTEYSFNIFYSISNIENLGKDIYISNPFSICGYSTSILVCNILFGAFIWIYNLLYLIISLLTTN